MCENNARIAAEEGESELAHAWGLAGLAAQSLKARVVDHLASSEECLGWVGHPLCCNLLQSLYVLHCSVILIANKMGLLKYTQFFEDFSRHYVKIVS